MKIDHPDLHRVVLETRSTIGEQMRETVHRWLREYNTSANPDFFAALDRGGSEPLFITAQASDRSVLGGLLGNTLLKWLRIDIVAVAPAVRRSGIGRLLMTEAERHAQKRGCSAAYVDTMSYQSPEFYRRLGYSEVGRTPNWDSHGHTKYYFTKHLE